MAVMHIRRFVPPWSDESQHAFDGRLITATTRLATVPELDAAAVERFKVPLSRMSGWVGDTRFRDVCKELDVCQMCARLVGVLQTWDDNPLLCMSQHAAFAAEARDPRERARHLAELLTIAGMVRADPAGFAETRRRERSLLSLLPGAPR